MMKKATLLQRLRFAWNAFWLKEFDEYLPFADYGGNFHQQVACDNQQIWNACESNKTATTALYQKRYVFSIENENAYFVCEDCREEAIGKMEKK